MTQGNGRISCPQCGANNFHQASICWQCNTPLRAGSPPPAASSNPAGAYSAQPPYGGAPYVLPQPAAADPYGSPQRAASPHAREAGFGAQAQPDGDPAVAKRAALYLALLCPWFGLPIGWAFMMFEDRRRQAIGRFCATWSAVAIGVHILVMFVLFSLLGTLAGNATSNLDMDKVQKMLNNMNGGQGGRTAPGGGDPATGP